MDGLGEGLHHPYLVSGLGLTVVGAAVLVGALGSLGGLFDGKAPNDFYSALGAVGGVGLLFLGLLTLRVWYRGRESAQGKRKQ